jgi:hypothetical protein
MTEIVGSLSDWETEEECNRYIVEIDSIGNLSVSVYNDGFDEMPLASIYLEGKGKRPHMVVYLNSDNAEMDVMLDDQEYLDRGCLKCGSIFAIHDSDGGCPGDEIAAEGEVEQVIRTK